MKIKFKKPQNISQDEKQAMYQLFSSCHSIDYDVYDASFKLYSDYALGYEGDRLVALSAIDIKLLNLSSSKIVSIYMGSSCVEPEYRSAGFIQKASIKAMLKAALNYPFYKKYIWCLAATYKPYMFFSKVLKEGYPKRNTIYSEKVLETRDSLIKNCPVKYGQIGWMNASPVKWKLKDDANRITSSDLNDPDVAFYHSFNLPEDHGIFTFAPASMENLIFHVKNASIKNVRKAIGMTPLTASRG